MSLRKGSNLIAGTQDVAQQLIATGSEGSANPVSSVAVNSALSVRDAEIAELGEVKVPLVGKGINLLDNWYFPNPVNQRGQSVYTGVVPAIDRWDLSAGASHTLTVNTGYVSIAAVGATEVLAQQCEEYVWSGILGKTVTASILLSDGTLLNGTTTLPASTNPGNTIEIIPHDDTTGLVYYVRHNNASKSIARIQLDSGKTANIVALNLNSALSRPLPVRSTARGFSTTHPRTISRSWRSARGIYKY